MKASTNTSKYPNKFLDLAYAIVHADNSLNRPKHAKYSFREKVIRGAQLYVLPNKELDLLILILKYLRAPAITWAKEVIKEHEDAKC